MIWLLLHPPPLLLFRFLFLNLPQSVLRLRDVYPGSWFLPIPDPGSRISDLGSQIQKQQKKREVKKICCHKFHKTEYYFIFKMLKKKLWANFQKIIEVFTQKILNMLSGIQDPEKTYSGSRIQGSKRHRIPGPDPQHCFLDVSTVKRQAYWRESGGRGCGRGQIIRPDHDKAWPSIHHSNSSAGNVRYRCTYVQRNKFLENAVNQYVSYIVTFSTLPAA